MEIYFIKKFNSINNGYNASGGGSTIQVEKFPHQKAVVQLTSEGDFVKEYKSISEANRFNGSYGYQLGIGDCCRFLSIEQNKYGIRSKSKSSMGYFWMFKEDYEYLIDNNINFIEFINNRLFPKEQRVVQLDLEGNFIRELLYPTQYQDEGFVGEYITRVLAGKRKTYHGFKWMWYKDYINSSKRDLIYKNPFCKPVVGLSFVGELLCKFDSIDKAANKVSGRPSTIGQCCLYHHEKINNLPHKIKRGVRSTKNYIWMFEEDYNTIVNSELGIERYLIDKVPGANTILGVDIVNKLKEIIKQKYNE